MSSAPRFLAFSGSARRGSLNRKLLAVAVEAVRSAGGVVELLDMNDYAFPLYHGDLEAEQGLPQTVQKFLEYLRACDGLLIACPEYNSMPTPLLKNTIDWCTRADDDPLTGKVAGIVSASPGAFGGIRSQTHVRSLLTHLGCHVVPVQCILPHADKAFTPEGALSASRAHDSVRALATALVETTRRLRATP